VIRRYRTEEHLQFKELALRFFSEEVTPNLRSWEAAGQMDRKVFERAGSLGLLGMQVPVEYGGAGLSTYSFNMALSEAAASAHFVPVAFRVHTDLAISYFLHLATDEQKATWLPDLAAGRRIGAIAISEPDTGSDVAGIRTRAVRDGDHYVLSGAKTFISSGLIADTFIVAARTSHDPNDRRSGLSLFIVDAHSEGFNRGRAIEKIGLKYSDTAELAFDEVVLPRENRLGEEGRGFEYLSQNLPKERVSVSVGAVSMAAVAVEEATAYASQRKIFGQPLSGFQNTKFVLAEASTEVAAAEQMLDSAVAALDAGALGVADAARLKLFTTEVQSRTLDRCLQVFGGYGFTREFPVGDMFVDARVTRIYGGTSEVMKLIIAKDLGLR